MLSLSSQTFLIQVILNLLAILIRSKKLDSNLEENLTSLFGLKEETTSNLNRNLEQLELDIQLWPSSMRAKNTLENLENLSVLRTCKIISLIFWETKSE